MQPFPAFAHDKIRKLAQHESGHWMIARALNFVPGTIKAKVSITPGCTAVYREGVSNVSVVQNLNSVGDVISYLERRIQVLWAGVIAEALNPYSGLVDRREAVRLSEDLDAGFDIRIAAECEHLLRNLKWAAVSGAISTQITSLFEPLWYTTIDLVEADSQVIIEIADRLAYRIEIAGNGNEAKLESTEIGALPGVQRWLKKRVDAYPDRQVSLTDGTLVADPGASQRRNWPLNHPLSYSARLECIHLLTPNPS